MFEDKTETEAGCLGVYLPGPCSIHVVYIIGDYWDIL